MKTRNEITTEIHDRAIKLDLYKPAIKLNGCCVESYDNNDWTECGEVYSDFWHVYVFDNGTYEIGWLECRDNGTTLVTKRVSTINEVYDFLAKQR